LNWIIANISRRQTNLVHYTKQFFEYCCLRNSNRFRIDFNTKVNRNCISIESKQNCMKKFQFTPKSPFSE
jgi:hypothetical protein